MKTALLAVVTLLLLSSCTQKFSPVDVVLKDSLTIDVVIKLENQTLYEGTNSDFYYSTFSISNNSGKIIDSIKIDIIENPQLPNAEHNRHTFKPVLPYEKNFVTIFHIVTSELKTTLEWW